MKVRVTNIQRFSLHDGPGIRTTVFLKGCSLHCPWCANPENICYEKQEYVENSQKKKFGKDFSLEDLEEEILKDHLYYRLHQGGVTFSGGEPLLQFVKLEPLLKKLKEKNIHICVETSLFAPDSCLKIAFNYVDLFFIDIKIMNKRLCKEVLGGNLDLYQKNMDLLYKNQKKFIFRIPFTKEYTIKETEEIICFLQKYKAMKVEVFPIHYLAEKKYQLLGKEMKKFDFVTEQDMKNFITKIEQLGIEVSFLKI